MTFNILFTIPSSESPFLGGENLLTTWELELGTSQSFNCSGFMSIFTTNRHQRLTNVDTGNCSLRFTISSSHSSLEPISSSTRQHFVDSNNMEWVDTNTDVEGIFASNLCHVFVGTDSGSFQSFSRQLFIFVRHQIDTFGEFIHTSLILAKIENSNLRIWDTPTESRLWVGFVLAISVTACRTTTHLVYSIADLNISDYPM